MNQMFAPPEEGQTVKVRHKIWEVKSVNKSKASRQESLEMRLISSGNESGTLLRIRAHRDELIAIDSELSKTLKLASDGSLTSSPI